MIICNILFWSISPINVNAQSPLWNPNYNKVQKLVFDNSASDEDLVNFTVLVHLNSSIIDWDDFQTDGDDIRFIDEDYETYLDYEVETWNHGYDAWIWVRVPQIDSNSAIDHIYMYYDNPLAISGEDKEGTWNNDYAMVQHMVDETNASILDSTQYDNDGTKKGVNEPIETTDGQINSAQGFDGVNDYINILDDSTLDITSAITIGTWINITDYTSVRAVISKINTAYEIKILTNGYLYFECRVGGVKVKARGDTILSIGTWYHIGWTYDNTTHKLYIDGIEETLTYTDGEGTTGDLDTNANDLTIGSRGAGLYFNGTIDSVRLSNTTRSADWIEAQYLSMTEDYITYKEVSLCESRANIFPLVLIALFVIIGIVVVSRT